MWDALSVTEAEAAGLSELAALDLAMARDFAARAQAAEDAETANDLARSHQRMARSYRQSLALKVRLQREMAQAMRDAPASGPPHQARAYDRVRELQGAVQREIFAEREAAEPSPMDDSFDDCLLDLLEERLAHLACADGFGLEPLEAQASAVCRELGLDPALAARWRELPDLGDGADPDPAPGPAWRGSG
jgi:hypothetical protein